MNIFKNTITLVTLLTTSIGISKAEIFPSSSTSSLNNKKELRSCIMSVTENPIKDSFQLMFEKCSRKPNLAMKWDKNSPPKFEKKNLSGVFGKNKFYMPKPKAFKQSDNFKEKMYDACLPKFVRLKACKALKVLIEGKFSDNSKRERLRSPLDNCVKTPKGISTKSENR